MGKWLLVAAVVLVTGCTTAETIEAAKPRQVSVDAGSVALKLVSAAVIERADRGMGSEEERQERLHLCVARTILPSGPEQFFLVTVSQPYPFVNERRARYPFHVVGDSLVLSVGLNTDVVAGCDTPKGMVLVDRLSVIEAKSGEKVTLPDGRKDAIVFSQRDEHGLSLAYVSAGPIFGGYHSLAIDISKSALYTEYKGGKPYLLLLTPIAAVSDVMLTVALAFSAATISVICPGTFASCD
jgi:hypothetical protein